jgi:hypothetical protein
MFEALFLLALFGVMYVDIIELLEKCKYPPTDTGQEVHLEYQESPRTLGLPVRREPAL